MAAKVPPGGGPGVPGSTVVPPPGGSVTGGAPAAGSSTAGGSAPAQEYIVRIPRETTKKHCILKFHHSLKIDLTKAGPMRMGRENNLRDYRQAYDMDSLPKSGAGSEFGREQREEARRKKYGIHRKRYVAENQPWLMNLGENKDLKRYKGVKEGGIADNASYYVFTQSADGAFEACPVDDWFHFTPKITHKVLTAEEAEEEFTKRDQTMNYFSIMVRNKMKKEEEAADDPEEKVKKGKKSKNKEGFLLTELDEWAVMSDGDVDEESDGEGGTKKDKGKPAKGKKKKSMKKNSDDEALEESDSFDEANEVDYITDKDSDSSDEDMYKEKNRNDQDKYKEEGVEDEEALKKLVQSDDEEEEEQKEEEEEDNEDSKDAKEKKDDESSDSSDSSGSDSDPEKEAGFSALFMKKKEDKKKSEADSRSRSATPTEEKGKKRKTETDSPMAKKVKLDAMSHSVSSPTLSQSSTSTSSIVHAASTSNLIVEGISEEAVRRYLLRKPMTTKDLVQKFKNTGLNKEQLVNTIAKILKRIDPEKIKIKDKLYLSIKKKE